MLRAARLLLATMLAGALCGCTLFPDKQPAPLNLTTSAERTTQILWDSAASGRWNTVQTLLGSEIFWIVNGKTLTSPQQIVSELQQWHITAAQVSNAQVKGNGDTMTVVFTLQTSSGGATRTRRLLSVWQQLPGKKAAAPYLLIVMTELPPQS